MPSAGSINNLKLITEQLPPPAAFEVTVAVRAIGLNFADIFAMQGLYKATPKGSFVPGLEFSGVVVAVGNDVSSVKTGDHVMGVTKFGAYATHINLHHHYVIPLPTGWTFQEGAAFLVQGLTAYYALLELGNLQPGMAVLIHSAAGGVGILANRIAKKFNAFTIGTVGSENKVELLQQEGYDAVFVRNKNFANQLREALGGRPLMLVLECIGGSIFRHSWDALAPMGRLVAYGSASFTSHSPAPDYPKLLWRFLQRPKVDPLRLPSQNKSLMGFNLIFLYEQTDLMLGILQKLFKLQLPPQHVGQVFQFDQMRDAIHLFQSGKTIGKVVVTV